MWQLNHKTPTQTYKTQTDRQTDGRTDRRTDGQTETDIQRDKLKGKYSFRHLTNTKAGIRT